VKQERTLPPPAARIYGITAVALYESVVGTKHNRSLADQLNGLHSTQSGAAARVLTDMFGQKSFTDTTHTDRGLQPTLAPRRFGLFR
jgi:hypothetical protein